VETQSIVRHERGEKTRNQRERGRGDSLSGEKRNGMCRSEKRGMLEKKGLLVQDGRGPIRKWGGKEKRS